MSRITRGRALKNVRSSADDNDSPPPLLEPEGRVRNDTGDEDGRTAPIMSKLSENDTQTPPNTTKPNLMDLLNAQFNTGEKDDILSESSSRSADRLNTKLSQASTSTPSMQSNMLQTSNSAPSAFMTAVGKGLLRKQLEVKSPPPLVPLSRTQRTPRAKSPIPMKKGKYNPVRYLSMNQNNAEVINHRNNDLIQSLMNNPNPVRVNVAVGNGMASMSTDKDVSGGESSTGSGPPSSSADVALSTVHEAFRDSPVFSESIIRNSSNHALLISLMVVNTYNETGKKSSAYQKEFSEAIFSVLQKYNSV